MRSAAAKARLQAVSYGQRKVSEAAVTFIICGTLAAHEGLPAALRPSVEAGFMSPEPQQPRKPLAEVLEFA